MAFNRNTTQEDLTSKTGTKERLVTSGVYDLEIKEAYITNSTKSKAQAVTIAFENDNNYGRVNFWFLKGDGQKEIRSKNIEQNDVFMQI